MEYELWSEDLQAFGEIIGETVDGQVWFEVEYDGIEYVTYLVSLSSLEYVPISYETESGK